jgi:hypothetical protein
MLIVLENDFETGEFGENFKCCEKVSESIGCFELEKFSGTFDVLKKELSRRFADFDEVKEDMDIFYKPRTVDTIQMKRNKDLQLELIQLQKDPTLKNSDKNGIDVWKLMSEEKYPKLRNFAMKMHSMFGSTYICECTFSLLKSIKSKERSNLSHNLLKTQLKAATSSIAMDFEEICRDNYDNDAISTTSDDESEI